MAGRPRTRGKCDEHPTRDAYADFQCSTCYKRNRREMEPAKCHPTRPVREDGYCTRCWFKIHPETKAGHHQGRKQGLMSFEPEVMAHEQGGVCAICGRGQIAGVKDARLFVDHDHKSGVVRGLLCHKCNVGLGMFDDDPNRLVAAMRYVIAGREKARQAAKEAAA